MPLEIESRHSDVLSAEQAQGMTRREFRKWLNNQPQHSIPQAPVAQPSVFDAAPADSSMDAGEFASRSAYRAAEAGAHRRPTERRAISRIAPSMAAAAVVVMAGSVVASAQMSTQVPEVTIAATNAQLSDVSSRDISAASRSQSRGAASALSTELSSTTQAEMSQTITAYDNTNEVAGATADETTEVLDDIRNTETFVAPVATNERITSEFGERWGRAHNGIDYGAPEGTDLVSVGKGTVVVAAYNSGLGNHVKIVLEDGTLIVYGHMVSGTVEVGDEVMPGDLVGYLGNTGNSTGPHLHFEVRPGGTAESDPIDPRPWLEERGALL
ncbi:M23 family metallopeptidase [Ornithinimicrobium sp. Arc0846-15]|nr:M23 family metallopeptidase [Ornithinimicrobium laminariae]